MFANLMKQIREAKAATKNLEQSLASYVSACKELQTAVEEATRQMCDEVGELLGAEPEPTPTPEPSANGHTSRFEVDPEQEPQTVEDFGEGLLTEEEPASEEETEAVKAAKFLKDVYTKCQDLTSPAQRTRKAVSILGGTGNSKNDLEQVCHEVASRHGLEPGAFTESVFNAAGIKTLKPA